MPTALHTLWLYATAVAGLVLSLGASCHAIIYKRDSRAATGWVGLIWLAPVVGPILYILLGINRVRRRAAGRLGPEDQLAVPCGDCVCSNEALTEHLPAAGLHLIAMARLNGRLTHLDLLWGNSVEPLINGDEAYPAMLAGIGSAERSITLAAYIFDNDEAGRRFVEALAAAVKRGVAVRVLIDAVGARYSLPTIIGALHRNRIPTAHFMPSLLPWITPTFNLRSHRKILVVDGASAFTGGMNIRVDNLLHDNQGQSIRDTHFRVTGPVVQELQAVFARDWHYTTGEPLSGPPWFTAPRCTTGPVIARAIPDGPDRDIDKMRMAFQGALSVAHHRVRIVTPYFLPDAALISALNTCALRGVEVDIVLPERNNLKLVAWASMAQMWQILEWGCRVWLSPPPFDHSKLLTVDGMWCMIGSANWDPRSLRLNFELGLECYCPELAGRLDQLVDERIGVARPLSREAVNGRSLPVKLRDGMSRLLAPYL